VDKGVDGVTLGLCRVPRRLEAVEGVDARPAGLEVGVSIGSGEEAGDELESSLLRLLERRGVWEELEFPIGVDWLPPDEEELYVK
jgi:hypothetical protein